MCESFLHPLNHCLAAIQFPLCLISHLNVPSLLSQPCPGLHLRTFFCGNRLVICSSYSYSYWPLLHLVVAEMEAGPLYPSSAPVVKAVPMRPSIVIIILIVPRFYPG